MSNVICIIQARMGSSRFPGKVLQNICDKTVLEHTVDRLKRVKRINKIVIATTDLIEDDVIIKSAENIGVNHFRGSTENVLSRFYFAAINYNAQVIVRVTSDCPLIDSEITTQVVDMFLKNENAYDYVSNIINRTFPRGLDTEVFSMKALEKSYFEATKASDKEHVTAYIYSNADKFKLGSFSGNTNHADLRWTLDTREDFELINKIYELLYSDYGNDFGLNEILKLYANDPSLKLINSSILQKKI